MKQRFSFQGWFFVLATAASCGSGATSGSGGANGAGGMTVGGNSSGGAPAATGKGGNGDVDGSGGAPSGGGGTNLGAAGGGGGSNLGGAAGSAGGQGGATDGVGGTSGGDATGGAGGAAATDAGGGTAGGTDAPSAATGDFGVGGDVKPCKAMFCESFEDGDDGAAPTPGTWTRQGSPTISTMHAARGKKALHVPKIVSGTQFIRETKTFPALGKSFYARIFLWVENKPIKKPDRLYHWTVIEGSDGAGGGGRVLRLGGHIEPDSPNDWLRFNYNTHVNGETGLSDKDAVIPPKKWTCLEAFFDMPNQEARFWLDGAERPKLHWKNTIAGFPFPAEVKSLSFGWAEYQPTPADEPYELYIDEIAIDSKQIGCVD